MKRYYCGNPLCKAPIDSDSTAWPLRCARCNQQCYPANCMPGGSDEGSYIRTRDGAFGLPTAILMVEGPGGQLVPFRYSPSAEKKAKKAEPRPSIEAIPKATRRSPEAPWYCGSCQNGVHGDGTSWPIECERCHRQCYPRDLFRPTAVVQVPGPRGHLVWLERAPASPPGQPPEYYCGNPPCQRRLRGEGWPLTCGTCGHDNFPAEESPAMTILMVPGRDGHLVPFRASPEGHPLVANATERRGSAEGTRLVVEGRSQRVAWKRAVAALAVLVAGLLAWWLLRR